MVIDWSLIIAIVLVGVVIGLIAGGVFFLVRIFWNEYKSKKQWMTKQGIMDFKNSKQESIKEEIEVPKPMETPQIPKQTNYKEDFRKFHLANRELTQFLGKYNNGEMSYEELENKFNYYQNQDYYKRILKEQGKK